MRAGRRAGSEAAEGIAAGARLVAGAAAPGGPAVDLLDVLPEELLAEAVPPVLDVPIEVENGDLEGARGRGRRAGELA